MAGQSDRHRHHAPAVDVVDTGGQFGHTRRRWLATQKNRSPSWHVDVGADRSVGVGGEARTPIGYVCAASCEGNDAGLMAVALAQRTQYTGLHSDDHGLGKLAGIKTNAFEIGARTVGDGPRRAGGTFRDLRSAASP